MKSQKPIEINRIYYRLNTGKSLYVSSTKLGCKYYKYRQKRRKYQIAVLNK